MDDQWIAETRAPEDGEWHAVAGSKAHRTFDACAEEMGRIGTDLTSSYRFRNLATGEERFPTAEWIAQHQACDGPFDELYDQD